MRGDGVNWQPFETWGIVLEAILAGGYETPLHRQRDYYAMLGSTPTLVRDHVAVRAFCAVDLNRLTFARVQKHIMFQSGVIGFQAAARVFALPPSANWDEAGNRLWSIKKVSSHRQDLLRTIARKYHGA